MSFVSIFFCMVYGRDQCLDFVPPPPLPCRNCLFRPHTVHPTRWNGWGIISCGTTRKVRPHREIKGEIFSVPDFAFGAEKEEAGRKGCGRVEHKGKRPRPSSNGDLLVAVVLLFSIDFF